MINNLNEIKLETNMFTGHKVIGFSYLQGISAIEEVDVGIKIENGDGTTNEYFDFQSHTYVTAFVKNIGTDQIFNVILKVIFDYSNVMIRYQVVSVEGLIINSKVSGVDGARDIELEPSHHCYDIVKTLACSISDNESMFDEYFTPFMDESRYEYEAVMTAITTLQFPQD